MSRSSTADAYSVTILCLGIPPTTNQFIRKHWSFEYKAVKEWERTTLYMIPPRDRKWLTSMAEVGKKMEVDILFRHNQVFDPDGLSGACKVILDALVNNKFLAGDSQKHIALHPHQEKVRAKETRIHIREAEGA